MRNELPCPSQAPSPTTSAEVDDRGEQRERRVDHRLPHDDVEVVEVEPQHGDPDRDREREEGDAVRRSTFRIALRGEPPMTMTTNGATSEAERDPLDLLPLDAGRPPEPEEQATRSRPRTEPGTGRRSTDRGSGDDRRRRRRRGSRYATASSDPVNAAGRDVRSSARTARNPTMNHRNEPPPRREGADRRGTAAAAGRPAGGSRAPTRGCSEAARPRAQGPVSPRARADVVSSPQSDEAHDQ